MELAPFLVSLDWLALNMDTPPPRPMHPLPWESLEPRSWWQEINPERVYMTQPTEIRTAQFKRVTYINDELKRKVLTVWSEPHDNRLHAGTWIQVQFDNATLYTGEWSTLLRMLVEMGCTLRGVSKVDISCDGIEGDGGDFPAVIETAKHGNVRYYGKCDWLVRSSRGSVVGGEFGHRSSNKFIRAYRKKREMKSKGIKEHIVKQWAAALGWDPMDRPVEVNRFEVSLKGKEVRRYFPDERGPRALDFVLGLADVANRVDVFASMAPGMFDFRTRATRARDAQPVTAWNWSRVVTSDPSLSFRASRNIAVTDHTIKTGLRAMFHLSVVTSDPNVMELAERKAEAAGPRFVAWFDRKRVAWTKEYGKLIAAGDLRTLEFFRALKEPPPGAPVFTREDWESLEQWEQLSAAMRESAPPADVPPHTVEDTPPDPDDVDHW